MEEKYICTNFVVEKLPFFSRSEIILNKKMHKEGRRSYLGCEFILSAGG
jgi:hypothetical protein